jgi:hypothetical protein
LLFSVLERIQLLSILPERGDITTIRIVRQLREDLSFTEEEHKELGFLKSGDVRPDGSVVPENRMEWNPGFPPKEIEIGDKAREVIVAALDAFNKTEQVDETWIPLFDRFEVE